MNERPDVVIYHHPCADGQASAWAFWKRWPDIELYGSNYGDVVSDAFIRDRNVLLVDFSYPREALVEMAAMAKSITIMDHHKTAQAALSDFVVDKLMPFSVISDNELGRQPIKGIPVQALFDQERSGCMMAWDYCFPNHGPTPLIKYAQDRDLWRWALPDSRAINAFIGSFPLTVQDYEIANTTLYSAYGGCVMAGLAVDRMNRKLVLEIIHHTARQMTIGGRLVLVANAWKQFASDVAGTLAEDEWFGASYFDREDGRREFSLRSKEEGLDVSEIAKAYGGGGLARAAGFVAERGWEGDQDEEGASDE